MPHGDWTPPHPIQPAPLPAATRPRPCDCTVVCGDDPWLQDGRATKCAAYDRLHPPPCPHCRGLGYVSMERTR